MQETEFDKFADEYRQLHAKNIAVSGENPDFFAEYKIRDLVTYLGAKFPEDLRILDFGAGIGTSVPWFAKHLPAARLTCVDVSRKSLEIGQRQHGECADFVYFEGETLPFKEESFDVAFAACVFHHIEHKKHVRLLLELNRVLVPGGRLIVFEHNPLNPLTIHAVNACPFDENAVLIRSSDLANIFKEAGFSQCIRRYRIFFPGFARALRPLESYLAWLPLGAQYFVAGCKHASY
jgi:ubiquinone/menaquinone biosynthesis C-methylase UbiE